MADSKDARYFTAAILAGVGAGIGVGLVLNRGQSSNRNAEGPADRKQEEKQAAGAAHEDTPATLTHQGTLQVSGQRAVTAGLVAQWTRPVVIAAPGLEDMGKSLHRRLGCEIIPEEDGPTLSLDKFKSGDCNTKMHWHRVVGRKVVFLFDTVDQGRLFEQLSILQALQGFAVPHGSDKSTKWKTYVAGGTYDWGRAAHITVVLPWYRPCQMERTSRWTLKDGKWSNDSADGQWLDLPTAQYLARLLATPGSVPPLPGPERALDGMPLRPLWRPPLELLFVELHEEAPIAHSVSDLGATIRMERFVPYFLDKYKSKKWYPGAQRMYVLFPDRGALKRNVDSAREILKLDSDHLLWMEKTRVAESIEQKQTLFYEKAPGQPHGEKQQFEPEDHVLIIDDFTQSGSTLFGACALANKMQKDPTNKLNVSIFVAHLVAQYDPKVVESLKAKLKDLGPTCRFFCMNTITPTTQLLKGEPQIEVIDIADWLSTLVQ